jgi:hypothetical protein
MPLPLTSQLCACTWSISFRASAQVRLWQLLPPMASYSDRSLWTRWFQAKVAVDGFCSIQKKSTMRRSGMLRCTILPHGLLRLLGADNALFLQDPHAAAPSSCMATALPKIACLNKHQKTCFRHSPSPFSSPTSTLSSCVSIPSPLQLPMPRFAHIDSNNTLSR